MNFMKPMSDSSAQHEVSQRRIETNLYLCKADIFLPRTDIPTTRKHLTKVLRHVDPGWKFIRIRDNDNMTSHGITYSDEHFNQNNPDETTGIQTLSVILFLNEEQYEEVLGIIHSETDFWRLRHTINHLNNVDKSTVIGCMNFYELSPDFPLWAVSPKHFGNNILRFNIFVEDFEKMREYYQDLTSQQSHFIRKGFCNFKIHSYPGLQVEISLKSQANMKLRLTRSAVLRLKFRKLDIARCHLVSTLEQINRRVWRTKDPEGNVILLEEIGNESRGKLTKRRSKSEAAMDELVFV